MKKNNIIRAVVIGFLVVLISFFFVYTIVDLSSYASASADSADTSSVDTSSVEYADYVDTSSLLGVWQPKSTPDSVSLSSVSGIVVSGAYSSELSDPGYYYNSSLFYASPLVISFSNGIQIYLTGSSEFTYIYSYSGSLALSNYIYIASVSYFAGTQTDFDNFMTAFKSAYSYVGLTSGQFDLNMAHRSNIPSVSISSSGFLTAQTDTDYFVKVIFNGFNIVYTSTSVPFSGFQLPDFGVYSVYLVNDSGIVQSFASNGLVYYDTDYEDGYNAGLQVGIEQGKDEGYNDGYNAGYNSGYDSGIADGFTNPIAVFLNPVDTFLSIDLFGSVSIGDILSVVLFVMVALIFIKMFAGG